MRLPEWPTAPDPIATIAELSVEVWVYAVLLSLKPDLAPYYDWRA